MIKKRIQSLLLHLVLIFLVVLTITPFVWMLLSSFKTNAEINAIQSSFLPREFTFNNYSSVQSRFNFLRYFFNSLLVTLSVTALVAYTSTLTGYVLEKNRFRGRNAVFTLVLATMMIPWFVTIIPKYSIMLKLGWLNMYSALIVPAALSGFGIFMMKQALASLPNEMLEAGRMDGASEWYILHRIVFPMSRNAIASIVIFQFLWSWEDYLWPFLVINSESKQVLAVGLRLFSGRYSTDYGGLFAAAAISILPVILIYSLFQKQFIDGLAASSVKG
ncbi:MAG: carbohydrate ABC transporter permease [Spirochaetales bacterium]|nr:carbohydrate ABC transporter permease [Spirochaetales bacterium]